MRLIDADRLLEERRIQKYYHLPNGDTAIPIIDIEHAPTIEPQPEIIRCKNCRHNGSYDTDCPIPWPKDDDDFCSYSER